MSLLLEIHHLPIYLPNYLLWISLLVSTKQRLFISVSYKQSDNDWQSSKLQKNMFVKYQFQHNKKLSLLLTVANEKHIFILKLFQPD